MKRFAQLVYLITVLLCAAPVAMGQTVTVTASKLGGTTPFTGIVSFQPTLLNGQAASAQMGGGGQTITAPITVYAALGVFRVTLPDTNLTNPQNICFKVTALVKGINVLGPGYTCVQPAYQNTWCTAGVCDFDQYTPNIPALALQGGGNYTLPAATASALGGVELATGQTASKLAAVATTGAYADLGGAPAALTGIFGDVLASGPGNAPAVLATVNASWGSCGDGTHVCQITTDGKGRVTGQVAAAISYPARAATDLSNLAATTAINDTTLTFAGAAGLTAGGVNQNVNLNPSGTGEIIVSGTGDKTITTPGTSLKLEETGDTYGTVSLALMERNGFNGISMTAPTTGAASGILDFHFSVVGQSQSIRFTNQPLLVANTGGEFDFGSGGPFTAFAEIGTAASAFKKLYADDFLTTTNCASSASPAACTSAAAGRFVIAASATSVVVNTTAVTAASEIVVTEDQSLGAALGVTCNPGFTQPVVTARTAGTSFTVSINAALVSTPGCFIYSIIN